MLHVRVTCLPDRTDEVVRIFLDECGTTNVVRLPGAVVSPAGDLVQAEVAREAVDDLLRRLRALGAHGWGSLVVQGVETALGADVERAEAEAPGEGEDAVIWDQLAEETIARAKPTATFLAFLVIATLIAAVGLLIDSTVLIVGAMVLGPEFAPLAGLAVALVTRRWHDARTPLRALAVGFALAVAVAALGVWLLDLAGQVPEAFVEGHRPLTSFVAAPDVFSVVVALLAGTAGTLSLTGGKDSPLVGVFISVTTVPAAADVAAGAVTGQLATAGGAAVQLVVNLGCIVAAAAGTLALQRAYWRRVRRRHPERRAAVRRA
ncbi:DUF389 domain-containing protein [Kineococcus glutinatus]|uniref:DUF389 domain-containing protein n=1 Tax=Kineococcus glutinatus TaxID=1070872 RepID=A0ABP9HEV6_9ACTN